MAAKMPSNSMATRRCGLALETSVSSPTLRYIEARWVLDANGEAVLPYMVRIFPGKLLLNCFRRRGAELECSASPRTPANTGWRKVRICAGARRGRPFDIGACKTKQRGFLAKPPLYRVSDRVTAALAAAPTRAAETAAAAA